MIKRNSSVSILLIVMLLSMLGYTALFLLPVNAVESLEPSEPTLDPKLIPKYSNQLVIPPVYQPTYTYDENGKIVQENYVVDMTEFEQAILPAIPGLGQLKTKVWGYGGMIRDGSYFRFSPSPTFEATRHIPINVTWENKITNPHMFPVDPTIHWANPNNMPMIPPMPWPTYPPGFNDAQNPVSLIPHLHGGEVQSYFDGNPEAWFTWDGKRGIAFDTDIVQTPDDYSAVFHYPNEQPATTLWYHDHALGITRITVMSGLAGFYILRDPADPIAPLLPSEHYEIPLVFQDRSFNLDGSMWFPTVGLDPEAHPYWEPEFFGNTIMVNGHVWPNLNVEPTQYRFRLLDGSNARFYNFKLKIKSDLNVDPLPFIQIGSDGGYLPSPVLLNSLTIAPGERADIIVDFSNLAPGTKIVMTNSAKAPFPSGDAPDPQTVGQMMQFTVTEGSSSTPTPLPATLNTIPVLIPDTPQRVLTLQEVMGPLGPVEILLDGQKWAAPISEIPVVGSTEDWVIVNPTADTHPIHLHLVQFQTISRQHFNVQKYQTDWMMLNGMAPLEQPTVNVPSIVPYLKGKPIDPAPNELGWKDTIQAHPGEITIIRVRFAPLDVMTSTLGVNQYSFDPTQGPGYVWHCHILDHEDNEMMRPMQVVMTSPASYSSRFR